MFDVASAYAALLPAALALPAVSSLAVSGVEPPSCRPRQVFASPAVGLVPAAIPDGIRAGSRVVSVAALVIVLKS